MNKHIKSLMVISPETKVFARFSYDKEVITTKWLPLNVWYDMHKKDPTNYVILPNEIVLETDFKPAVVNKKYYDEHTKPKLTELGLAYITAFTGNKSYHTHILFDKDLTPYQKVKIVESWFGEEHPYDPSMFHGTHGVGFIGAKHPITKVPKTIIETIMGNNEIDLTNFPERKKKRIIQHIGNAGYGRIPHCSLLLRSLQVKFPEGARNNVLVPNFLAREPSEKEIEQFAEAQEMSIGEVTGWLKSDKYQGSFNCKQLRYMYSELEECCADGSCNYYNDRVRC